MPHKKTHRGGDKDRVKNVLWRWIFWNMDIQSKKHVTKGQNVESTVIKIKLNKNQQKWYRESAKRQNNQNNTPLKCNKINQKHNN